MLQNRNEILHEQHDYSLRKLSFDGNILMFLLECDIFTVNKTSKIYGKSAGRRMRLVPIVYFL